MVQKSGEPVEVGSLPHYLQGFLTSPSTVWVATSGFTRRQRKLWRSRTTRLRSEAPGCAIGDVPPTFMGSILSQSHSKDPYEPTSPMGCSKGFFSWLIWESQSLNRRILDLLICFMGC